MSDYAGAHPAIGALDVCPLVWLDPADRDAARTEAVAVAAQIGGLGVPVFLYGELAREPGRVERAYFRNGGLSELWLRMEAGELRADFGPRAAAPSRRRDPGHRPPAACRLQRRARQRRHRGRRRRRRRPARGGWRPARRAGDRAAALQRPRPGLDQRPRPAGDRRSARWSSGCGSWRRRSAPARSRPSWSASFPPAALVGLPGGRADPRLRSRAARDRAAARRPDRLNSRHGSNEEETPSQAPRHPGRPHRHQAALPPAQPRGGQSPRPLQAQAGRATRPAADLAQLGPARPRRRGHLRRAADPDLQTAGRRRARLRRLHARLLHPDRLLHRHDHVAETRASADPRPRGD